MAEQLVLVEYFQRTRVLTPYFYGKIRGNSMIWTFLCATVSDFIFEMLSIVLLVFSFKEFQPEFEEVETQRKVLISSRENCRRSKLAQNYCPHQNPEESWSFWSIVTEGQEVASLAQILFFLRLWFQTQERVESLPFLVAFREFLGLCAPPPAESVFHR